MPDTTAGVVYEQAARAIEQQSRQLDELRSRTAVILAAAGVVTGFLGGPDAKSGLGAFGYLALAAFVVAALSSIWVLLPRWTAWSFSINAKRLLPFFLDETEPEPVESLFRYLATEIQDDYAENADELDRLFAGFNIACMALAVEVVLWFLDYL